jgi:predicted P-loop ATPase
MGDGKSKDDLLILHKSWIQEWGEIERVFSKRQAGELKAFLSRRKDTYRQPYARQSLEYPRRSIIVGSANDSQFLNDATGSRRFWIIPVEVGRIDLETLKKERDAIWSAAVFAYKQNESWWLSQSEEKLSHHNNEKFQIIDEWVAQVEHYIKDYQRVSITEILTRAFDYELNKIDRPTQMRVASILTSLGWKKVGQQQHQGKRQVVWQKPTPLGQSVAEVLPPETTENRTIVTPTIPNKSNDQISNKKENSSSMSDPKKEGEFVFEKVEKKIQQGVEVLPSHSEQGIEGAKPPATPAPTPDDKALPEPTKNSARLSKEQNTQGQRSRS